MVTINFNFSADTAQGKDLSTAFTLPSPEHSLGEKNRNSSVAPSPQAAEARLTDENEAVPTPVSNRSASTQAAIPKPTDRDISEKANNHALPTPITTSEEGPAPPTSGIPPSVTPESLPQPTVEVAGTAKKTRQSSVPTPNDHTSLAEEVNEAIDKGEKKPTRSKSTRSRSTTKKK